MASIDVTAPGPKRPIPLWVLLMTAALAVVLPMLTAPMYLFDSDGGHYIALARSLAESGSYVFNGRPEVMYPPGLPVLLAPAALLFDGDLTAISRWATVLSSLVFPATYVFVRDQGIRHPGFIAIVTVAASGFIRLSTGNPVSDLVFMACSLALLIWWERTHSTDAVPVGIGSMLVGGLLLLLAVSTRTIGIALLLAATAATVFQEWRTHRGIRAATFRAFIPVLPAWIYFIAWTAWTSTMRQPMYSTEYMDSYVQQILLRDPHVPDLGRASMFEIATRPFHTIVVQGARLAELITAIPWVKPSWFSPLVIIPLGLTLVGCWRTLRTKHPIIPLYLAGYAAVLLMWPFDEADRFLIPIVPIFWVLIARGVAATHDAAMTRHSFARKVAVAVALVAMAGAAQTIFTNQKTSRQDQAALAFWVVACGAAVFWKAGREKHLERFRRYHTPLLAAGVIAFVVVNLSLRLPWVIRRHNGDPIYDTSTKVGRAAEWLKANAPADAIVQATFPDQVHFATGLRTIGFPVTSDTRSHTEVATKFRPQFLVLFDSTEHDYFKPSDESRYRVLTGAMDMRPEVAHAFTGGKVIRLSFPR